MPILSEKMKQKAWRMAQDDRVATMAVVDVRRKHRATYPVAIAAIRMSRKRLALAGRMDEIESQMRLEKRYATLRGVGGRYPGILSRVHSERNNSAIARDFGVTREYVRRIRKWLAELAEASGRTRESLLDDLR